MSYLQRWRHSRGYGVHSPFSYEVVTRAVRPGNDYAWYGYSDIRNAMGQSYCHAVEREAKILLRLAAMLRPGGVFLPHGAHPAYHAALRAAGSKTPIYRKLSEIPKAELICSYSEFVPLNTLCKFIAVAGHWIALRDVPQKWDEHIFASMPEGVMFRGRRNILVIHHAGMAKQRYPLSI